MARETKVGLLAGLGFIVCFAVILANRGQLDSRTRDHTFLAKANTQANSRTRYERNPRRQVNTRPQASSRTTRNNPVTRQTQRPPTRVDMPQRARQYQPAQHQSQSSGPTGGQHQLPERIQSPVSRRDVSPQNRRPRQDAAGYGSLTSQGSPNSGELTNRGTTEKSTWGQSVDGLIRYAAGAIVPASRPATNPSYAPRASAKYKVKDGDTLYKIAARKLGKSSRRNVDAIFDANRAILSSPDQLKVGMEIVIPTRAAMSAQSTMSSGTSRSVQRPATNPNSHRSSPTRRTPKFRWYQIKQNDRYINIARTELGDAKRWHEIHDLNKRNFPDPDKIRVGVRIKLPLTSAVASSRPGR